MTNPKFIIIALDCGLFTDFVADSLEGAGIKFRKVAYDKTMWIRIVGNLFCSILKEDKQSYRVIQFGNELKIPKDVITSFVIMDA